jgi:pimeloyl-ACP methyl ester carboxylesterase
MPHLNFPLHTRESRIAFQQALKLLVAARATGWTLSAVTEGYAGGLPAGQFVLTSGAARETIPFRLDPESLAGFRVALGQAAELPAADWLLAEAKLNARAKPPQAVLVLEKPKAQPVRAVTRSQPVNLSRPLRAAALKQPSAYDLNVDAALRGLRAGTGPEADQMRALLGDDYFKLLGDLARRGPATRGPSLGKVLVLPGIMGSKLGRRKSLLGLVDYSDVIWLDPLDMRLGRLADLALRPDGQPQKGTRSVGVLYTFYLRLKLTLDLAGFDADFHDYDWRRPVRDLGADFARFLNQQSEEVTIVAHSMGGVVSRAALKQGAKNVKRLIMIGTPNHGSFVPVQAMRAAYPFLKTLAVTFDRDLPTITEEVFASFAGLYDMLPAAGKFPSFPIFDPTCWPQSAPHARADLIRAAAGAQALLADADERFHLICGVDQETVVEVRNEDGEFVFVQTKDGDGTVPRISAELPGCPTLYVKGSHGMLPNLGEVCDLAVDLARDGKTDRETLAWQSPTDPPREVRESALRVAVPQTRGLQRGEEPSPAVLREILQPLLALPPLETHVSVPDAAKPTDGQTGSPLFPQLLKGILVRQRQQRQLEVALFPGSLTQVSSRAYLLGLFQGVAPAGAASVVDGLMGGVINDFVQRRMLSGRLGEIFIVPKGRSFIAADHVIFVGLGPFDRYQQMHRADTCEPEAMRLICESAVRTCLHANIEEFATVLLGGSAAANTSDALRLFTRSFLDALKVADPEHRLRKITLCETDPQRIAELRTALMQLAATDQFSDVELELRDLPEPPALPDVPRPPIPLYLLTRMVESPDGRGNILLETSLLLPRSKAAVLTCRRELPPAHKAELLAPLSRGAFSLAQLNQLGQGLADMVFEPELQQALKAIAAQPSKSPLVLVVVHDAVASQLPWEALRCGDWAPALCGGLVRQHLDANLSVAKWLEHRADDASLDVLLVTNPTGDLAGAEREGDRIRALLSALPGVRLTERRGAQATREQLLTDFRSGRFDVIHYAGHAFFSPTHPGRSGLLCAGEEVLAGTDLAGLSSLPSLVFFNACESGLLSTRGGKSKTPAPRAAALVAGDNVSVANAFIRGGVANFLGTYWPVGDAAALKFSECFYPLLLEGKPIGKAVLAARQAVQQARSVDWADYLLYGNPDFVLKQPAPKCKAG